VKAGDLGLVLLIGAAVVIAAIVAARLAHGIGLPGLLVFLGLGLALGEAGLGVRFDNAGLAQALGLSALVLILAEGGLTTSWAHARAAAPAAVMLATAAWRRSTASAQMPVSNRRGPSTPDPSRRAESMVGIGLRLSIDGITLSDREAQGERAPSRRCGRTSARCRSRRWPSRYGHSARPCGAGAEVAALHCGARREMRRRSAATSSAWR
jgi:hypothetical protein